MSTRGKDVSQPDAAAPHRTLHFVGATETAAKHLFHQENVYPGLGHTGFFKERLSG